MEAGRIPVVGLPSSDESSKYSAGPTPVLVPIYCPVGRRSQWSAKGGSQQPVPQPPSAAHIATMSADGAAFAATRLQMRGQP